MPSLYTISNVQFWILPLELKMSYAYLLGCLWPADLRATEKLALSHMVLMHQISVSLLAL